MAVPDYFGISYLEVLHVHVHCVHEIFNLHRSGTLFFLRNVDTFLEPKIRQPHFQEG